MSISDKIQEAREWSRCIDTLKASVDSMYEICRIQQNILGCEEAIMFLKNGIRDFLSLVDTIKIEQNWENSEKRPMTSLAWEIRGSAASRSTVAPTAKELKEKQCQTPSKIVAIVEKPKEKDKTDENEWHLVERRKGGSDRHHRKQSQDDGGAADLIPFPPFNRLKKAPKSAMDLPQTKASMAKMAYSRQLLFEKHKKTLMEKFNSRRRMEKHQQQSERAESNKIQQNPHKSKPPSADQGIILLAEEERKSLERDESMAAGCLKTLIDQLSDDCEWRAMTEEEESLAQEEESLKKEIEEEEENLSPFEDDLVDEALALNIKKEEVAVEKKPEKEEVAEGHCGHYRNPGELAQLRAKLLSPTKRRRTEDIDSASENKLRRAEELRTTLQQERAQRLHLLHQRVEEVREKREQIQQKKLAHLEMVKERIQKADENRQKGLEEIVQRAQEDEMKIMEINLLNNFEAANQRLGKRFTQIRERNRYVKMIQKAEEERQRRIEENRQQQEEAEKRRKEAEEQRTQRLMDQANQHQERQSHALRHRTKAIEKYRAKVAQHSQKIYQRKARELADKEKLLDKIQRKHDKRTENYEQSKEQVRRRANELSSPRPCHYWTQTMADFSHFPSDMALREKPLSLEKTKLQDEEGNPATIVRCFRCNTEFFNDLHLMSHVLSTTHLAKAGRKREAILDCTAVSYDFLRNELERITSPPNLSEDVVAVEPSEVMTKSTDEFLPGTVPPLVERVIAKNAAMLISDQILAKLLVGEEMAPNAGKLLSSGAKKKRAKMRQKFVREFEAINLNGPKVDHPPTEGIVRKELSNKLVDALLWRIGKCSQSLAGGEAGGEEMVAVEKGLTELLKAIQCPANSEHENSKFHMAIQQSDLVERMLALDIQMEKEGTARNIGGHGTRVLRKSLILLDEVIRFNVIGQYGTHICCGGKALLHLCDLFHQNAIKAFTTVANASGLCIALFILYQFGQLISRVDTDQCVDLLLFSYLCSCCSLAEFISLYGRRMEPGDLLQPLLQDSSDPKELFGELPSPCEVITSFLTSLINVGKKEEEPPLREKVPSLERNNSVGSQGTIGGGSCSSATATAQQQHLNRLRLCSMLWMYCLSMHGYQHFRQIGCPAGGGSPDSSSSTLLPSSSPSSPAKTEHIPSQTTTLAKCILRQFIAMADANFASGEPMMKYFLDIENERTMNTRMICIFRSILKLTLKGMNQQQSAGKGAITKLAEECIQAVGHFAAGDERNQLLCVIGWQHSVLSLLCSPSLPLEFVHSAPTKHFLLPTLIAILCNCPAGIEQIRGKFCLHYLIDYIKAAIQSKSAKNSDSTNFAFLAMLEPFMDRWISAKSFFEASASIDSM